MQPKVLLVEDATSLAILYQQYVKDEPFEFFHVETGAEAKKFIQRYLPHVVILDLNLPDIEGQEILDWIKENEFPTSVLIATAHGSVDIAVDLLRRGADDFLEKPIVAERLKASIHVHLKKIKLEHMVEDLKSTIERPRFHGFIGTSQPMQKVYKTIEAVAPTNASVFIVGESGTGKEVCAEAIHKQSERRDKPFVAINCGAIPKDLMESEIFGHIKGAYTGATTDRRGAAMQADGGTLFLDELCEMDLDLQKKLLRFLQTSTFTPLGDSRERKVDVRIICATNRDPMQEVNEGRFREDLFYRVHVIPVVMPPLRERDQDIVTLANHFIKTFARQDHKAFIALDKETERVFKRYSWPGNVRQLQNVIRNIVVLNDGKYVTAEQVPELLHQASTNKPSLKTAGMPMAHIEPQHSVAEPTPIVPIHAPSAVDSDATDTANLTIRPMWQVERETIQQAIDFCDGNVLNAAVLLELSPSTVYRKKQAWENEDQQYERA
ncbi:sigma-54-dependent Fis family transcriptional regulator [Vibrio fluvialis]|uniref:sigma-54-dependent transcriptional regulator n=1 Tax=Vibrio fluvialis TaxID=676 RepID=UPI0012AE8749|nr:sigma-54 dependent transcriptional regulator [Vibrio fluvialis]EKO3425116.1 sigma-54-dependent Fis family transcriptional regulator [Vibrio fluvialis]EKO3498304.1 sigma-54-dependent Fis family transcriptional regulator [Vibrio fluvialis]EKO3509784.1 sigma-54-dependent Fis family transcriptional regulator [Vibrio fluvialis]EKO3968064.1 sigma-54-dependent Fis family transcriptional regulator [Vibrio fluvialis]EKZ8999351.1 sigma-54-dependent Fis family transcriptional regulator [Vibrio fluvial